MTSATWFHWSSLWGTPENPSQTELCSASHSTETTLCWRQVAFAVPSNVGIPSALCWVSLWSRWGDISWNKLVSCFGTHKTPTCHSSTAFHQYPPFPRALTHPGPPLFLQLKHFPSQYHWRVTWKRNLAGWGFPMQCWGTLTEPPHKMFVPLVPTCVCNCACWKEPTTTMEIKAIQHATPRSLFWLPSQMWR